jgi:hypothetical protein
VTDFGRILAILVDADVDFILIGGTAGNVHGAARVTYDVDVVYARDRANLERLASALAPHSPYPRGAPAGLPFIWDAETLGHGLNFTLTTELGDLDLLGIVTGGGDYPALLPDTSCMRIFDRQVHVVDLHKLIELKRAAGRPKDFDALAELDALLEERASTELP